MAQSVAEFLAQGGKITTVKEGASKRTQRSMYMMFKDDERSVPVIEETKEDLDHLTDAQFLAYNERNNIEEGQY